MFQPLYPPLKHKRLFVHIFYLYLYICHDAPSTVCVVWLFGQADHLVLDWPFSPRLTIQFSYHLCHLILPDFCTLSSAIPYHFISYKWWLHLWYTHTDVKSSHTHPQHVYWMCNFLIQRCLALDLGCCTPSKWKVSKFMEGQVGLSFPITYSWCM